MHIIDLSVKHEHRRQGIAGSLVRKVASIAMENGHGVMAVRTFAENREANAFYRACGARLDDSNVYYLAQKKMASLKRG